MAAEEVMERYVAAARRGDFDAAFAMFAEDIVFRNPRSLVVRRRAPRARAGDGLHQRGPRTVA